MTDKKKFLDEAGLSEYDAFVKKALSNIKDTTKTNLDTHTNDKSNPHSVTKAQVGLGNVNNVAITADEVTQITTNKNNITNHTNDKSNPHSVTKAQVGLGNVDNTSDANKPISTATQKALDNKAAKDHTHDTYVVKIDGKGLSTNDYTTAEKNKLAGLENFSKDYNDLTNKPTIPTKTSQLTNDSDFTTQDDLTNVIEIAEGKTATYVINTGSNSWFNTTEDTITIANTNALFTTSAKVVYLTELKLGDIVLIKELDLPDRYVGSIDSSNVVFYKMETSKVDLSGYAKTTEIPTKVGELENDIGFATTATLGNYYTKNQVDGYLQDIENNYLPLDGSKAMTGDLDMGSQNIKKANEISSECMSILGSCMSIYSDNGDMPNPPTDGDIDTDYYSKGIVIHNADNEEEFELYFPYTTGTFVVKNEYDYVTGVTCLENSDEEIGIYFGNMGTELVLYAGEPTIALCTTGMFDNDCEHYLKFPDTSDNGDGSYERYDWELPAKSGTIALLEDIQNGGSGGSVSGDYLPLSGGTISGSTQFGSDSEFSTTINDEGIINSVYGNNYAYVSAEETCLNVGNSTGSTTYNNGVIVYAVDTTLYNLTFPKQSGEFVVKDSTGNIIIPDYYKGLMFNSGGFFNGEDYPAIYSDDRSIFVTAQNPSGDMDGDWFYFPSLGGSEATLVVKESDGNIHMDCIQGIVKNYDNSSFGFTDGGEPCIVNKISGRQLLIGTDSLDGDYMYYKFPEYSGSVLVAHDVDDYTGEIKFLTGYDNTLCHSIIYPMGSRDAYEYVLPQEGGILALEKNIPKYYQHTVSIDNTSGTAYHLSFTVMSTSSTALTISELYRLYGSKAFACSGYYGSNIVFKLAFTSATQARFVYGPSGSTSVITIASLTDTVIEIK